MATIRRGEQWPRRTCTLWGQVETQADGPQRQLVAVLGHNKMNYLIQCMHIHYMYMRIIKRLIRPEGP